MQPVYQFDLLKSDPNVKDLQYMQIYQEDNIKNRLKFFTETKDTFTIDTSRID